MTVAPNHVPEDTSPVTHARRRSGRKAVPLLVSSLLVALAVVLAVMWVLSAQELRDTRAQVVDLTGQAEDLQQQVVDVTEQAEGLQQQATEAQDQQGELQRELDASQRSAEAELADLEAERKDLQGQELTLNEREQELADLEQQLDNREADLASQEQALTTDDDAASSQTDTEESLTQTPDFDQAWLLSKSQDAIRDIRTIDRYMQDGIGVPSALSLLSGSFGRMAEAGVPPGLDPVTYLARLQTLKVFAADAGDLYDDNPMEASAKYEVIRKQTGILFTQINNALDTDLQLP